LKVVAALLVRDARVLACQRPRDQPFPLKWEFPGGKVEAGEDELAALGRELREELGVEIGSATEVFRHRHPYAELGEVEIVFYRCERFRGAVRGEGFHRLLWARPEELCRLDFLEGDRPLIEKLSSGELRL
jgi:8-oxo-dGTP diphosphatase